MLNHIEALCAVIETGSINGAATRMHLSQPAVTKQMHALEDELGVQLLVRGPRGVVPTPAGRQIYRLARRAVQAIDGCRRIAQQWRDPGQGQLLIASGLTLTLFTLPPVIKAYSARVPGVRLQVVTASSSEALERVLDFSADVAFVTTFAGHPEVQALPLFIDPLVAVVAGQPKTKGQGRRARGAAGAVQRDPGVERQPTAADPSAAVVDLPATVADLAGRTLISFHGGSGLRQYIDQVLETKAVRPDVTMEFDSIEAIKTMAGLGLGVALLPWSAVRDDAAAGRLVARRLKDWPDEGRTVTLIRRKAGLRSGAVREFTAVARSMLAGRSVDR